MMLFDLDNAKLSLEGVAQRAGLRVIELQELEGHKHRQIAMHPANRLWAYRDMLRLGLGFAFFGFWSAGFVSGIIACFVGNPLLGIIGCGCLVICLPLLLLSVVTNLRGPASFVETEVKNLSYYDVPKPIIERAVTLKRLAPHLHFLLGELKQGKFKLDDPYLAAEMPNGDRVILGIWDCSGIIACA